LEKVYQIECLLTALMRWNLLRTWRCFRHMIFQGCEGASHARIVSQICQQHLKETVWWIQVIPEETKTVLWLTEHSATDGHRL
jgi:hypothetical protein